MEKIKLQPPEGTVIETREEAIRVFLSPEYVDWFAFVGKQYLVGADGGYVNLPAVARGFGLPYTVIGVLDGYTEDPNFSMNERVEQIAIKAGEMSWDDWQWHFKRMSAVDLLKVTYNTSLMTVGTEKMSVRNVDHLKKGDHPFYFNHNFTYTPVYPSKVSSLAVPEKPLLYLGCEFHTWEELTLARDLLGLRNENSEDCFADSEGKPIGFFNNRLAERNQLYPLPWKLIKMPDIKDTLYRFAVFPSNANCFEDEPNRIADTFEEAIGFAKAECHGTGEDMNIVLATFRAEHIVNVHEKTWEGGKDA